MIQTRKNLNWVDESGTQIPFNRLTKLEVMQESELAKIVKEATKLHKGLVAFKKHVSEVCDKLILEFMLSKQVDSIGKGNVTLFNFDRSIKIERNVNDRIEFDDITMKAAKQEFDAYIGDIDDNADEKQMFMLAIINEAFSTSRGKLDPKKVFIILKYESKVKDERFQKAVSLVKDAIRHPDSKTYTRVWVKDGEGSYQNIDLNFSSI